MRMLYSISQPFWASEIGPYSALSYSEVLPPSTHVPIGAVQRKIIYSLAKGEKKEQYIYYKD